VEWQNGSTSTIPDFESSFDATSDVGEEVHTSIISTQDGSLRRSAFRTRRVRLLRDGVMVGGASRGRQYLVEYSAEGVLEKATVLRGCRVAKIRLGSLPALGGEPPVADHCFAVLAQSATDGVILACSSAETKENWCDRLCFAGCVMDDLEDQVTFSASLPRIRLCGPKTSRTNSGADLLALKVASRRKKQKQLMNESYFLLTLDNPGIPRAHGLYTVTNCGGTGLGLLIDYKAGGPLSSWIPQGGFHERVLKTIAAQLRDVLLYLHKLRIVHRDIKPENVLCERGTDGSIKVCLADFGLAAQALEFGPLAPKLCGTCGYMAPELFERKSTRFSAFLTDPLLSGVSSDPELAADYTLKSDVFSFGMLVYTAALGSNPFQGETDEQTLANNERGIVEADKASRLSLSLREFLKWTTARSPWERCSIFDVADHAWFFDGCGLPITYEEAFPCGRG
jgi:serine/threonine protein kinase